MPRGIRTYLDKRADLAARPLVSDPCEGVDQVIVIPVLAEHEYLFDTLASLAENPEADLRRTLVLCVVNNRAEAFADRVDIENNRQTLATLDAWIHPKHGDRSPYRLGYVDASSPGCELPEKGGVGLARKLGLDWGLAMLDRAASAPRLLLSLDADTQVEPSYLTAVRQFFAARPDTGAAVVSYAHRLDGPPRQTAAILCYEAFLRYHVLGLTYAGSPYAFPSIGSTMVCTASAYAAVSGMNRRQAGEDFYFLQQLAKTAGMAQIHATTVHPSSRPSSRVPFGTGQRIRRFLDNAQDQYLVYDPQSYVVLGQWLALVSARPDADAAELMAGADTIRPQLEAFLAANQFPRVWQRLRENSPDPSRLVAQFHRWFDGFKTLKLIHNLRDNGFPQCGLFDSLAQLLTMMEIPAPALDWDDLPTDFAAQKDLLDFLRRLRPPELTQA